MDPLKSKVNQIQGKLGTLYDVFSGQVLHAVPHPTDPLGRWAALKDAVHAGNEATAASQAWDELKGAFLSDDASAFSAASVSFATTLDALPAAKRPSLRPATVDEHAQTRIVSSPLAMIEDPTSGEGDAENTVVYSGEAPLPRGAKPPQDGSKDGDSTSGDRS